ncbi:hypothetical protein Tco_0976461 [Tanacetum coccineum]|uniref:Uncharacterized protein n=1 Tax=Tanacetum coccineum TaxID=301880 RepID=A0ABQ5EHA2_9ASTR
MVEIGGRGGSMVKIGGRGGSIAEMGEGLLAKHLMESNDCLGGGGFVVVGGRSSSVSKSVLGEVGGVENKSSVGSKLMASGEECLDGWVGSGGGEVKGGGVVFGTQRERRGFGNLPLVLGSMRPRPSLRRLKDSRLRGLVRISATLSSEETFSMEIFPY